MKLLLDTHTLIWLDTAPEKLSPTALAACEAPDNELYFSVVSAWEMATSLRVMTTGTLIFLSARTALILPRRAWLRTRL